MVRWSKAATTRTFGRKICIEFRARGSEKKYAYTVWIYLFFCVVSYVSFLPHWKRKYLLILAPNFYCVCLKIEVLWSKKIN